MNNSRTISSRLFSIESLVVLYFLLLLLFGTSFTKFKVIGPLYLHDVVLGAITLLVINNRRWVTLRFLSILTIIIIAFIYLAYSLLHYRPAGEMLLITFRQFNLFIYIFCAWVIFNMLVKTMADVAGAIRLIKWIAIASILLQVVFILYGYLFIPNFSLFREGEYNYFSPLVIFGVVGYGAYVLAFEPIVWKRYALFFFCVVLSTTLGHSSAFFALFVMLLLYFFVRITPLQRLIALGIIVAAVLSLLLLPQFTDANAGWRLLYWKHVLVRLTTEKYTLFGFGFGQPYMTYDYAVFLNRVLNSAIMLDEYFPLARYLAPPHNSLITIAFHIGLLPALLLFVPLKGYFKHIFFKPLSGDSTANFLLYTLTGSIIWISFNVILELPHAATYFWLVYFTTAFYLNKQMALPAAQTEWTPPNERK